MNFKKIRIILSILLSIVFLVSFAFTISAHPGSLDGNGGHYNHTTGEYHYHEGINTGDDSSLDDIGTIICLVFTGGCIIFIIGLNVWYYIDELIEKRKQKRKRNN